MKLIDLLKEVGEASSKPYSWKQIENEDDFKEYAFQTDSETPYNMTIDISEGDQEKDSAVVNFGVIKSFTDSDETYGDYYVNYDIVTNKGELYRVMATVVEILKDFIKKTPTVKYIQFETTKGKEKESNVRTNLYTKYIQKNLPNAKVDVQYKDGHETTSIKLKEIGDASAKPYSWKNTYHSNYERNYSFETESGQKYLVVIEEIEPEDPFTASGGYRLEVRFFIKDEEAPDKEDYDKVVNKQELFKVMSTMVDILRYEIKENPHVIKAISFSPSKRQTQDKARLELYKRFLKNFYPNVEYQTYGDEVIAILKK